MPLDREQIDKLLGQEKARQAKQEGHSRWFTDERLLIVAEGLQRGAHKVTIEGRTFTLETKQRWPDDILVSPVEGFVPSGWFSKKSLRSLLKQGVS